MLDALVRIAEEAGDRLLRIHQDFSTDTKKGEWDFVTSADIDLDEFLRQRLCEEFPGIPIMAEESYEDIDLSGMAFLVDPIDGTKDFVFGGEDFCMMIGLLHQGEPMIGVVHMPKRALTVFAERGKGTFEKSPGGTRRLQVSDRSLHECVRVGRIVRGERRDVDSLDDSLPCMAVAPYGSSGMKYWAIASGEADVLIGSNINTSKWDTCATTVILEEAGGEITDLRGRRLDYQKPGAAWDHMLLASNSVAHEAALTHINSFLEQHPNLRF